MALSRSLIAFLLSLSVAGSAAAASAKKPVIQVAVLLDTSNSMDGLIDQARTQLWRVVNELATAKKNGVTPDLRVALYEYGNDSLPAAKGHIRRVVPLTSDLDKVSEELFALDTNGGQEYCGHVIDEATKSLEWSGSNDDLKLIFIAGNEEFTQGNVDFRAACRRAIAKGIIVNTIYCGAKNDAIAGGWRDGASLADGSFLSIDQNARVADIPAPQDKEIARLGEELNKTYIAYGRHGAAGAARQSAQDANLAMAPASVQAERQVAKTQAAYSNSSWDVVDAKKEGVDVAAIDVKDLPPEMQKMTPAQRKAYVEQMEKKRAELQAKIRKLDEARKKYVAEQMKKTPAANMLDTAVVTAVRSSGTKKGYKFQP
jgi:von Willebrand factor type A domain